MSNRNSRYDALDEFPFLKTTGVMDDPLEKELWNYGTLKGLHEVSSDLMKNNPIAAAFAMAYVNAFMGGHLTVTAHGPDYAAKPVEKILNQEFKGLDINRLYSLDMIMEYIIFMTFKKGDVLIHTPYDKERGEIGTMVELIDAGRISTPQDLQHDSNIRNGIKYGAGGRIIGYYVKPLAAVFNHSRLNSIDYNFIYLYSKGKFGLIKQNCMLFKSPLFDEFGGGRGLPPLTQSSRILRHIIKYIEAVVIGANVAACFAGFITTANPGGAKKSFDKNDRKLKQIGKLSPGGLYFLRRGEEISFGSPSRPADNTDGFVKRLTIIAAASIRWPYEMSQLHLENTSFSSWKGGQNEVTQNQNRWSGRLTIAAQFIAGNIHQEAVIKRMVKDSSKVELKFQFPKFDALDSEKKARANGIDLDNGTTSLHQVSAENNLNYDELEEEKLKEGMDILDRQAKLNKYATDLENELGIILIEESPSMAVKEFESEAKSSDSDDPDTRVSNKRRPGQPKKGKLSAEDKLENRRKDGNE